MGSKRNEYLDISDEENASSENDAEVEDSRFSRVGRSSAKRRKLSAADHDDSRSEASDASDPADDKNPHDHPLAKQTHPKKQSPTAPTTSSTKLKDPPPTLKPLTPAQLAAFQRKARKTGVVYLSRIPPFMKPSTLRHLLSPYGTLLRIFLTPEPTPSHTKRVRAGGNRKRSFIDGWVEFASKKRAKICAETLNGNILGGKKGGWYHDDIWNIKYLRGFKWDDLMEQVQEEAREREGRLRAEIQQEARERRAFMENVESSKMERGMETKKRTKKRADGVEEGKAGGERIFRQKRVKERDKEAKGIDQQDEVKRVLSKIF